MENLKKHSFIIVLLLFPLFLSATIIPFELIDGKIIVDVTIKNNHHNFVFDTGAPTIISAELKDEIKAKKSKIIFEMTDANSSKSKMDVFSTDALEVSGLSIKKVNFSFTDINWISSRACKKIDGILGANMMKDRIWRIDFKNKIITVFDKSPEPYLPNSITIPFSEENFTGVPRIKVKIRNQDAELIFDTGSNMAFTINQQIYGLVKDNNFLTFEGLLSQSLNSINKGERLVDVMKVEINNTSLDNQIVDSIPDALNLLGTKFMENYTVDIDFISKKIFLYANGKTVEYSSFGISFAPIDNSLIIVNKLQIPQLSEFNLSEKIIKINNTDVSKMSNEAFCEIKKILDNNQTITIENESHKTFTLEKKNVLQYLN